MRTQLLCTFVNKKDLNSVISLIIECYDVVFDKIYVFENNEDPNQLFCTYNVVLMILILHNQRTPYHYIEKNKQIHYIPLIN